VNLLFAALLDQRCVAGFGNRWANEVCFRPRTQHLHTGQTGTAVLCRRKSRPQRLATRRTRVTMSRMYRS
jgi:endonuclease-8